VSYHEEPFPRPDLSVITGAVADKLAIASELVDWHDEDFAGAYVNENSQLVIVAVNDRGEKLAVDAFGADDQVRIERGTLSLRESGDLFVELIDTWPSAGDKVWMSDIDPATSGIRVGAFKRLDDADKAEIEGFAVEHDVRIDVYIDLNAGQAQLG
jgi:hypothetical protein